MRAAIEAGDAFAVTQLLQTGTPVNETDEGGEAPAHVACASGQHACLDVLLNASADPNTINQSGKSLAWLSCDGHPTCLELLIRAKADVDRAAPNGMSPAFVACARGNDDCLEMLIKAGADLNAARRDGFTPILMACMKNHREPNRGASLHMHSPIARVAE